MTKRTSKNLKYVDSFNENTLNEGCMFLYTNFDCFLNKRSSFVTVIDDTKPTIIGPTEIKV